MKSEERRRWEKRWAERDGANPLLQARGQQRYRNHVTHVDGVRFDSRLEADRYCELKLLRAAGEVRFFIRQAPFDIAPGVKYRADFVVSWADGRVSVEDTKGHLTDVSRVKIAAVQERYGIEVTILARADVRRFHTGRMQ